MDDSESDTFHPLSKREEFCQSLRKIGVNAEVKPIDADESENYNYYSKHFSNTPAMITSHGVIQIKDSNIDAVQIVQKG